MMSLESLNSYLINAYSISTGIMLYAGIQYLFLGFTSRQTLLYRYFGLTCFMATGFQISVFTYYLSSDPENALFSLRVQAVFALLSLWFFLFYIGEYSQERLKPVAVRLLGLIFAGLVLLNVFSSLNWRFQDLQYSKELPLSWDETLLIYYGEPSVIGFFLVKLPSLLVFIWALYRGFKLFRQIDRKKGLFLMLCVSLIFISYLFGLLIDAEIIDSFYTIGFAFSGFILMMAVSLSIDLHKEHGKLARTSRSLKTQLSIQIKTEHAIRQLLNTTLENQNGFFQRLLKALFKLTGSEYSFVALKNGDNFILEATLSHLETTVDLDQNTIDCFSKQDNCDTLIFPDDVQSRFPNVKLLKDIGANSLINICLCNDKDNFGRIILISKKPLDGMKIEIDLLSLFVERAVSEIKRMKAENRLKFIAYQDYLTGLPNRAQFNQHLKNLLSQRTPLIGYASVLLIDLDHFKTINDALSHEIGDRILKEVARRLEQICTNYETFVSRLGGDEFIVTLTSHSESKDTSIEKATQLSKDIIQELSRAIAIDERSLIVGASIGIATFNYSSTKRQDILRQADMALYQAKSKGRGNFQQFLPPMQEAADSRLALEDGLRNAISNNELSLNYQPQVNRKGECIGVEALLRWKHPKMGWISPVNFIPIAEETGLIHSIGSWVLEQACLMMSQMSLSGVDFKGSVSVNVSSWQLSNPNYVDSVRTTIKKSGVKPERLILELTENGILYDIRDTIGKFNSLRNMGLKISLDDFGTGYSSLAHLKDLPLDELKIDRAFINSIEVSESNALVKSMVAIGKIMNLKVIAEGVETVEQLETLTKMKCSLFQGFYFAKPMTEKAFFQWIAVNNVAAKII